MTSLPIVVPFAQVRLSVAMQANLAWNFGWQYYGYRSGSPVFVAFARMWATRA